MHENNGRGTFNLQASQGIVGYVDCYGKEEINARIDARGQKNGWQITDNSG